MDYYKDKYINKCPLLHTPILSKFLMILHPHFIQILFQHLNITALTYLPPAVKNGLSDTKQGLCLKLCRHQTPQRRRPRPRSRSLREQPRKARRTPQRTGSRWTRSPRPRPTNRRAANRRPENLCSVCSLPWGRPMHCRTGRRPKRSPRSGDSPSGAF